MATYQIHFQANAAQWPTDPQQRLALWEQTAQAADALVETGVMRDLNFISASEGYVTVDGDSQSAAIAVAAAFFPNWSREIIELVPWEQAKEAILGAVRQATNAGCCLARNFLNFTRVSDLFSSSLPVCVTTET